MNTETYEQLPEDTRAWLQGHGGVELDDTLPPGVVEQRPADGPRVRMNPASLIAATRRETGPGRAVVVARRKRERHNRTVGRRQR
jgi:hypothetical protein